MNRSQILGLSILVFMVLAMVYALGFTVGAADAGEIASWTAFEAVDKASAWAAFDAAMPPEVLGEARVQLLGAASHEITGENIKSVPMSQGYAVFSISR